MLRFIKRIFTWWHGSTIGTQWHTFLNGVYVGSDNQGNRYYKAKKADRRWVIYNGDVEASRVPPEWHAWLHKTVDATPLESPPKVKGWEKEHEPNLTGSEQAYFPPGSLNRGGKRERATGDYEAWTP
jgi:NADH:ubiquinone oxidoreductase subunit